MPRICDFNGVEIYMYHDDHPWPHLHALYAEFSASIRIDTMEVTGRLPPAVLRRVLRWMQDNQELLLANARRAEQFETLQRVAPPRR